MDERTSVIPLSALDPSIGKKVKRAGKVREPVWVTEAGQVIAAILDVETYNELVRLADKGLVAELAAEVEEEMASGTLLSWEEVRSELLGRIEGRAPATNE